MSNKEVEMKGDEKNVVSIMTIHAAKGLEFDIVYHLNLNEWELPKKKIEDNDFDHPQYPTWNQDLDLHWNQQLQNHIHNCDRIYFPLFFLLHSLDKKPFYHLIKHPFSKIVSIYSN